MSHIAPRGISRISPLKIGFVASFVLHSSLFAFLFIDFERKTTIDSMRSQALNIGLENISGKTVDSRKMKRQHKKHHRKPPRESIIPAEKPMPEVVEEAENSVESDLDSTLGVSTNLGDRVEILGNNDALYATILDIINKNRNYPKIARIQRLQDRIQVEFVLLSSGEVIGIRIVRGRHRILNDDAIETIRRSVAEFPKMERSKKIRLMLKYDLTI